MWVPPAPVKPRGPSHLPTMLAPRIAPSGHEQIGAPSANFEGGATPDHSPRRAHTYLIPGMLISGGDGDADYAYRCEQCGETFDASRASPSRDGQAGRVRRRHRQDRERADRVRGGDRQEEPTRRLRRRAHLRPCWPFATAHAAISRRRGVHRLDIERTWRVVQLDHAGADEALAPQVAGPSKISLRYALVLARARRALEVGDLAVAEPLAAGIVGLARGRYHLDDGHGLGDHGRRQVEDAAGDHHVVERRPASPTQAVDQRRIRVPRWPDVECEADVASMIRRFIEAGVSGAVSVDEFPTPWLAGVPGLEHRDRLRPVFSSRCFLATRRAALLRRRTAS